MEVLTRALAISDQRGKNFASLQPASASAKTKIPAPSAKVVEKSSTFLRTPYRKRLLAQPFGEKDGEVIAKFPTAALAQPSNSKFLPLHRCRSLRDKRKTPASSDTGVSPTSITCSYYSSSGRSITLSVKYAPVGSSCEPLRTLSAEPSSVKVSLKSPFILTASSIESNSTTA